MYVFVALQRASRKIGSPIELPSLNKDFTYLLTYLLNYPETHEVVMTLYWRRFDVIAALCSSWVEFPLLNTQTYARMDF